MIFVIIFLVSRLTFKMFILINVQICWNCKQSLENCKENYLSHIDYLRYTMFCQIMQRCYSVNIGEEMRTHMWWKVQSDLVNCFHFNQHSKLLWNINLITAQLKLIQFIEKSARKFRIVTKTNLAACEMRQLKVSMSNKHLTTSLAMFENAGAPTLSRKMCEVL